jgi:hypothetical protein
LTAWDYEPGDTGPEHFLLVHMAMGNNPFSILHYTPNPTELPQRSLIVMASDW